MLSDSELWDDFRSGRRYALSHIYFSNARFLVQYGRKFTREEEVVKDAIQEVFISLIKGRERLGPTDNIRYYLMASLRHRIVRQLSARNDKIDSPDAFELEFLPDSSPEEQIIYHEEADHHNFLLKKAFQALSPRQREILFYRFECEFDYDHIGEIMSLKYDTARKMVHRSLKSLRSQLAGEKIFFKKVR